MTLRLVSQRSSTGMQKAAVLPVPFLALASTSRLRAMHRRIVGPPLANDDLAPGKGKAHTALLKESTH